MHTEEVAKLKERILIVDDERGIVDTMKAYFSTQYEVLTAYSGEEAIQKAENQPDLILLDINMPGIDGLTVCQTIREHVACPILFLTARMESTDKINGFQAGADDYIVKPFDLDELAAEIQRLSAMALAIPAADIAMEAGDSRAANIALLGAFSQMPGAPLSREDLEHILEKRFKGQVLELNRRAFAMGCEAAAEKGGAL